ncbi:MAG TPA: PHP domain-containing protein [Tepidimicrobium sp.]|nr:PHP domain-containing protein [Tepidimicrobium sp.]
MIFDLHVHTNLSDGIFSPEEVVSLAVNEGLNGIAITDHDSTSGIEQAIQISKKFNDFIVIPGIEFGCVHEDEEVHILGYFIDYKSPKMRSVSHKLRKSRWERGLNIIDRLKAIDIDISYDRLKQTLANNDYVGRPHIARILVEAGYVNSIQEAFNIYLDRGKPAYVERYRLDIRDTIDLIHELHGLAVLAHPGILRQKKIIDHCIAMGIDGIEAIHPKHNSDDVYYLIDLAKKYNLFTTGGSDFHGDKENENLLGRYYVNLNDILEMRERI